MAATAAMGGTMVISAASIAVRVVVVVSVSVCLCVCVLCTAESHRDQMLLPSVVPRLCRSWHRSGYLRPPALCSLRMSD